MHSHLLRVSTAVILGLAACEGAPPEPAPDSTMAAVTAPDTTIAADLRDSAKATLATLLQDPATATFDSVVVIQPPHDGERLPAMAVCGRIGGRPGIGGGTTPVRFVYQSKWTVFVEEAGNQAAFGELWAQTCALPAGIVLLRE